jgi:hypothetical protein
VAKHSSKIGRELERLKKRLQVNRKHLKQTELKAEDLNALIEAAGRPREDGGVRQKPENKGQAN